MKNWFNTALIAVCMLAVTAGLQAQKTVMVGGESMYPLKNIIENA